MSATPVNNTTAARSAAAGNASTGDSYTAPEGAHIADAYMGLGRVQGTSIDSQAKIDALRAKFMELNPGKVDVENGAFKLRAGETYQVPSQADVDAILNPGSAAPAPQQNETAAPANNDTVETTEQARPNPNVTGAQNAGAAQNLADANARIASLEARLTAVERQNREDAGALNRAQADYKREIARQERERTKPGFMDAAMEVSEFFMRFFSPFFNLISAIVRIGRILWKVLIKKEKVDWTSELIRLAGDIAGIMPGLGWVAAVTDQAMDVWDSSKGNGTEVFGWRREKESVLLHSYRWAKEKITGEKAVEDVPPEITDTQATQETFSPAPVEA